MPEREGKAAFYAAVGAEIIAHTVDAAELTLERLSSVMVPEAVQYAYPHPRLPLLYVGFSNRPTSPRDDRHGVQVYRINRLTGALSPIGTPVFLASRPIHLTVDPTGHFLLVVYNTPSALTVHRLAKDGTIGGEVQQAVPVDAGIYAHQVRVAPSGRLVVLSARGNDAGADIAGDPGALRVFRFQDGQLSPLAMVTEGGGLEFGPRHVDFHPDRPWLYVSMERSNQLLTYHVGEEGISPRPLFVRDTALQWARSKAPTQYLGPIHLHPDGRHLYLVNRSDSTRDFGTDKVHAEGENTVACFTLDLTSGEPKLVQTIDTQSFHCRTFAIHPQGRMLVTAAVAPLAVQEGEGSRLVPAGLTVFRVEEDGTLSFARKYDMETSGRPLFWCGMASL
ncbi:lactonase family protein [Pseudoroseomonas ludipueritiae]|uniref:Beta-propeller fold lactonase family protein n=1 Tax=Pseudoroseomonas ludipueritiae TaxID=198093 RepID=A0ABR7RAX9_9PROT|nr:beta-propeller fold lactonase family protein [Pseudoroseomonas ludipueritiae]MBC9178737.1 beta-propeller fold lactonase family protein [Pseudoroseomonas ludipueritiae]